MSKISTKNILKKIFKGKTDKKVKKKVSKKKVVKTKKTVKAKKAKKIISKKIKKVNLKHVLEFGSIKIDLNKLMITNQNSNFKINNTEKTILEKMINNPGKVFSRIDIGNLIKIDKERSIDVIITRLRKKIETNPKNPKYLQTIRGSGYVLWVE